MMPGILLIMAALVLAYCSGVCVGASTVREYRGELRLPEGWWFAPAGVACALLWCAFWVAVL